MSLAVRSWICNRVSLRRGIQQDANTQTSDTQRWGREWWEVEGMKKIVFECIGGKTQGIGQQYDKMWQKTCRKMVLIQFDTKLAQKSSNYFNRSELPRRLGIGLTSFEKRGQFWRDPLVWMFNYICILYYPWMLFRGEPAWRTRTRLPNQGSFCFLVCW